MNYLKVSGGVATKEAIIGTGIVIGNVKSNDVGTAAGTAMAIGTKTATVIVAVTEAAAKIATKVEPETAGAMAVEIGTRTEIEAGIVTVVVIVPRQHKLDRLD